MLGLPKIGAFVLETLTTGMYTNPLDAVREFVQNATDSILQAQGNLPSHVGRIEVQIEPTSRKFIVRDNGTGIPHADVYSRLINIGMSDKNLATNAGFRGIGRLAGIAYCQKLSFRTSAIGENVISTVEIDCQNLRKAILPAMRQVEELADIMAKSTKVTHEESTTNEHFFEVLMEGVSDAGKDFLDWQVLETYLSQIAPVGFDAQSFCFAPVILEWVKQQRISIPSVTLVIKAQGMEREIFKPYKTHYNTQNSRGGNYPFDIKDIGFYPEAITPNTPFWLWYSKTDLLGTIDDDRVAGFRLRSKNIAVGGAERVAEIFAEIAKTNSRFNAWYIGEIHILSHNAIPNARRDGFEDAGVWPEIRVCLVSFIKERIEEIRQRSQARNLPAAKIIRAGEQVIEDVRGRLQKGFVSEDQRATLLDRVIKEQTVTKGAVEKRDESVEVKQLERLAQQLEETRQSLEQDSTYVVEKLRSNLDRKQRKVIAEILQVLHQSLDEANYKKAETAILTRFQIQAGSIDK